VVKKGVKIRRIHIPKNIYNAEEMISSFSNLKFHVLFMLVPVVAHVPSPCFACHGDGSTEGGLCSVAHEVEIRYTEFGLSFGQCTEVQPQATTPLRSGMEG
jgi:hypothetical protein